MRMKRTVNRRNAASNDHNDVGTVGDRNNSDSTLRRKQITESWCSLAQERGLETALRSLRDPELLHTIAPTLPNWDELVDFLDKRICSESLTLESVVMFFSIVQAVLFILFLCPCLWPIVSKLCICQLVERKGNKFLYINKPPKCGGRFPPPEVDEENKVDVNAPSEQYVTSYMVLHVKSIVADWLPENIKANVRRESQELKASKELFAKLCKKLKHYENEHQLALTACQDTMECPRRSHCQGPYLSRVAQWCSNQVRWATKKKHSSKVKGPPLLSRNASLKRTYSAIPAREYEKVELINRHLPPTDPQPLQLMETTSLVDFPKSCGIIFTSVAASKQH